ncbi:hypothetical protein [Natrarchaeobaculum sulfurireducens]|uniref:hypothetical protein n=1 Tax=Natrarchaeobaculum sulfurireducens TaxID=2044521 RepID=UPI000E3E9A85|nr:hypothetical protein [Natrarchaeobaculum sulfurireducens]
MTGDRRPLRPSEFVQVIDELPTTSVDTERESYLRTCYACQLVKTRRGDRAPLSEDAFLHAIQEFGGVSTSCEDEIAVRYKQQLRLARKIGDGHRCPDCGSEIAHVHVHRHCQGCGTVHQAGEQR